MGVYIYTYILYIHIFICVYTYDIHMLASKKIHLNKMNAEH